MGSNPYPTLRTNIDHATEIASRSLTLKFSDLKISDILNYYLLRVLTAKHHKLLAAHHDGQQTARKHHALCERRMWKLATAGNSLVHAFVSQYVTYTQISFTVFTAFMGFTIFNAGNKTIPSHAFRIHPSIGVNQ